MPFPRSIPHARGTPPIQNARQSHRPASRPPTPRTRQAGLASRRRGRHICRVLWPDNRSMAGSRKCAQQVARLEEASRIRGQSSRQGGPGTPRRKMARSAEPRPKKQIPAAAGARHSARSPVKRYASAGSTPAKSAVSKRAPLLYSLGYPMASVTLQSTSPSKMTASARWSGTRRGGSRKRGTRQWRSAQPKPA